MCKNVNIMNCTKVTNNKRRVKAAAPDSSLMSSIIFWKLPGKKILFVWPSFSGLEPRIVYVASSQTKFSLFAILKGTLREDKYIAAT